MGQILQLIFTDLFVAVLLGATIFSAVRKVHYKGDMSSTNPKLWFWGLTVGSFALLLLLSRGGL